MTPIHQIVKLAPLRPKCCVDRHALSDERLVTPILVLRVGLSHGPVALAKIKVSCRGDNDFLPLWIVLVVFSFYSVTASSNKRLVMPTPVLRVGLSHEPVALAKISSLAAARKISSRLGSAPGARADGPCLKKDPLKMRAFTKRVVAQ